MNNILWISLRVPYDNVRHAGGKIENYYLKRLIQDKEVRLKLITFSRKYELEAAKYDHSMYGIDSDVYLWDAPLRAKIERQFVKINAFDSYGGGTIPFYWSRIKLSLKAIKMQPDVIILQWTEILLFLPYIKKFFPNSKIVSIEEDVLFLNFQRQYENCKAAVKKKILKRKYERLKCLEIERLKACDWVVLNNPKDKKLVEDYGVKNTWYWTPFFQDLSNIITYKKKTNDILYYGSMNRPENHLSVMRLINEIFPKIKNEKARIVILGNGPQEKLLKLQSDRIIVTGFVEDITPYFENAICLCAPLVLGAGVKIKIIESMSAGLAVITNDIGIEGIPAKNGKDYLYCSTDEEFANSINTILEDPIYAKQIGSNAKTFICNNYNAERDAHLFVSYIKRLIVSKGVC